MIVKNIAVKNTEVQMLPVLSDNLLIIIPENDNVGTSPTVKIILNENVG